jgi:uncharacterized protein (TIGR02246 family)
MDDEDHIRAVRARYNAAIAARDPAAIADCVAHDCALIASTGVAVTGRDALLAHWKLKFKQDGDVVYVREPATITLDGDAADERGLWSGHWTNAGARVEGFGDYVAGWRRDTDGEWRVASEWFTPRR